MNGTRKENRTGVDTLSTFNINYEIDLKDGFPLLTTKKINWWHIVAENIWFLSGEEHIGFLQKHGIKFWDPWADEDGLVPSAYGNFWRHFPVHQNADLECQNPFAIKPVFNDQIAWVINEIKQNPMSRRLVVSAWAPGNAQTSKLPPCHCLFVFNVQNVGGTRTLNLHLTQRSCDIALGVPYNIAGYAFILSLVAHLTGLKPGIFAHTLVDAHAYTSKPNGSMAEFDHVPGLEEQLKRMPKELPGLKISSDIETLEDVELLLHAEKDEILSMFELTGYDPHAPIKFKVAV